VADFESGIPFSAGFSSQGWTTTSDPSKVIQGKASATSGSTAPASTNTLRFSGTVSAGFGSFEYRVSSEPIWDKLQFLINGNLQQEWSGEVPWSTYIFPVTAGHIELEWRYIKDAANTAGLDAAFIDSLDLPRAITGTFRLGITRPQISSGFTQVKIHVLAQGSNATRFAVQSTTNITSGVWTSEGIYTPDQNGDIFVSIPAFASDPRRFFRVVPLL
jgi:hypothetical protein